MLPSAVRSALDIKLAIDHAAEYLEPIGFCKTKIELWKKDYNGGYSDEFTEVSDSDESTELSDSDESTELSDSDESTKQGSETSTTDSAAASKSNKKGIRRLKELYADRDPPLKNGVFRKPFSLDITRAGCEFSGEIVPLPSTDQSGGDDVNVNENLMAQWFENATVSPFGDVQAQENKVDRNVRNAREILASEFHVSPDLLQEIATIWDRNFLPAGVRVEPYKIHMYGPGGKFRTHKDTPEKGLVGTFLVGLGDSTPGHGHLKVLKKCYRADAGNWVAFHPSVPHEVTPVDGGYRAVIAFKVFKRESVPGQEVAPRHDSLQEKMRRQMEHAFAAMHAPFGLLLEHQYCMGTTEFNGFDSILRDAAVKFARKHGSDVHFLPVLTKHDGFCIVDTYLDEPPESKAPVYPLTEAHVNAILQAFRSKDVKSRYGEYMTYKGRRDPPKITTLNVKTGEEWLDTLKDVPFYAVDFEESCLIWKEDIDDGAEYTGNEARPATEDSIYLSYAMVVIPKEEDGEEKNAENQL